MYTLHITWPGMDPYFIIDNIRTLLFSFVSQWVVMHFPNFKGIFHIWCYYLCTVFADYISLMYLMMFPEGNALCKEININLCLIFGQYFGKAELFTLGFSFTLTIIYSGCFVFWYVIMSIIMYIICVVYYVFA